MTGPDCVLQLDKIMCDLTCTWTKRLVTWLVFGPNDLWLDLTSDQMTCDLTWRLTKSDLWLDLDLQGNDLWLDLDLQGNDLWLDLDLQKMTCCHLCLLYIHPSIFPSMHPSTPPTTHPCTAPSSPPSILPSPHHDLSIHPSSHPCS